MFETHVLNEQGFSEVNKFKSALNSAISEVLVLLPEGRDRSLFITKIEEAVFFGTRAVASKSGNFSSVIDYAKTAPTDGEPYGKDR